MIVLEDNFCTKIEECTYVALGSFDGLHMGHMSLINKAVELSKKHNEKSMVFTFKNHPLSLINQDLVPKLLMDNDTKLEHLRKNNIDIVNFAEFNQELMKMNPEEFIKNMIEAYNVKGIVVGFNFRFGYKNKGDNELLTKLSEKYGFELYVVGPIKYEGEIVSSSRIRKNILEGNLKEASNMLTRPYMLRGNVVQGKKNGRKIGFPTANLGYDNRFVIPKRGVYYTKVEHEGKLYKGITNVGYNPTVGENDLTIETNILDFSREIYGESLNIYFIERFRDEIKFQSLESLKIQLAADEKYARKQEL
ncbi:MAG: bifunctional riboflavin kinase/FAD synthetase [Bacillota bacterium]|nr:bifunctional riboflavin kinase/FAD synthetase [Bacillota bacterium]